MGPNWGGSNFAVSALHPRQPRIDLLRIEVLGIEFLVDPFHHVVVLGVLRIADRLQEIRISPDAAAIVGWARALAVDATRNRQAACGVKYLFDGDLQLSPKSYS